MSGHINPNKVKRAFSGAVESYDVHAVLQREIADRLLAHVTCARISPKRILDIGCGTGYFTRHLVREYPKAEVHALDISQMMVVASRKEQKRRMLWHGKRHYVAGDACALPFTGGRFDLVTSNLAMQWVPDPQAMMQEMRRVLAPGGLMVFSTFGRRTLSELRHSLAQISNDRAGLVLPFPDVMSLGNALMELPVELPVTDSDLFTLTYPDTMGLVRELKGMGASASAIGNRKGGLYGRKLLKQLEETYGAAHRMDDGRVRASFEALYAQAWYAEPQHTYDHVIPIAATDGI